MAHRMRRRSRPGMKQSRGTNRSRGRAARRLDGPESVHLQLEHYRGDVSVGDINARAAGIIDGEAASNH